MNSKRNMGSRIKRILGVALLMAFALRVSGQRQAGYFGMRNLLGVQNNLYLANFYGKMDFQVPSPINGIKYERMLNSVYTAGASVLYNRYRINDVFVNDGNAKNYFIRYNESDRRINNGDGALDLSSTRLLFQLKRFAKYRAYMPYGKFKGILLGVSRNMITIREGYNFKYTEYYGSKKKEFETDEPQYMTFTKFHLGVQVGRTVRFIGDRLLFSYAATLQTSLRKKFKQVDNLNERFLNISENFVMNYQLLSLSFELNYAF